MSVFLDQKFSDLVGDVSPRHPSTVCIWSLSIDSILLAPISDFQIHPDALFTSLCSMYVSVK